MDRKDLRNYKRLPKPRENETNFFTFSRLLAGDETTEESTESMDSYRLNWYLLLGCGSEHLLAELGVVLEAIQGFLGRALVRLLLTVPHGVAGIDAT